MVQMRVKVQKAHIEAVVLAAVAETVGTDEGIINPSMSLHDLGFDSLERVDLLGRIERVLAELIPEEVCVGLFNRMEMSMLETPTQIIKEISGKLQSTRFEANVSFAIV